MKLQFENLGPLVTGELELADLTVICGENNTGKTYLTYTLYGLLQTLTTFIKLPDFDLQPLRQTGVAEINLATRIIRHTPELVQQAVEEYCVNLHRVLAAQNNRFVNTKLQLLLDFKDILKPEYNRKFTTDRNRRILTFQKPADDNVLTINAAAEAGNETIRSFQYQPLIERVVKEICFDPVLLKPFIVSTERTGAVTFQGELNLAKNRLFDLASEVTDAASLNPAQLLERVYGGGYPMPVRDNVDFINSLASVQTQESELLQTHPGILEDFENLIGGSYKLLNNVLHFVPKGTRGVRLRMGESSSAVRSLVILGYYLKHRARRGDLLMIDEPELNLHPANQRRLARLLARLVNVGIKVFVTTHSDYIVKEFNTLIMLNVKAPRLNDVRAKYHYSAQDCLAYDAVRVYVLREDFVLKSGHTRKTKAPTLCVAPISPTLGIEVASFDETINDMTAVQQSIYYHFDNEEA